MKKLLIILTCSFVLCSCEVDSTTTPASSTNASVTTTTPVPSEVLAGRDVTLAVTVSNGATSLYMARAENNLKASIRRSLTIKSFALPAGFTRLTSSTCVVGQTLAVGASCTLVLGAQFSGAQTVSEQLKVITSVGSIDKPVTFQVKSIADPSVELPSMAITSSTLSIVPGNTSEITIKNTGTQVINTPEIQLPSFLSSIITNSSIAYRGNIAPGASHTFSFKVPDTVTFTSAQLSELTIAQGASLGGIKILGANLATTLPPTTATNAVSVSSVTLSDTDEEAIVVENNSDETQEIDSVDEDLPSGVEEVSDSCSEGEELNEGGECVIVVEAGEDSEGSGSVDVESSPQDNEEAESEEEAEVQVEDTTLSFASASVSVTHGATQTVTITNSGDFAWTVPSTPFTITENSTAGIDPADNVTVSATTCSGTLDAGDSCTVTVSAGEDTTAGDYDLNSASSSNADASTKTFTTVAAQEDPELSVALDDDWSGQGMALKRFLVTNAAESGAADLTFTSATITDAGTPATVALSQSGRSGACDFEDGSLEPGASCYIYVKAQDNSAVGTSETPELTITTNGGTAAIGFTYTQYLYAGGVWYTGSSPDTYVDRYDGSTWSSIGRGPTTDNNSAFNNYITTLAVVPATGNLYAGGLFSNGSAWNTGNEYIAKWDGAAWSEVAQPSGASFGGYITAMTADGDNLYVTPTTATTDSGTLYSVAFKLSDGTWSNLGEAAGTSSGFRALAVNSSGDLYGNGWLTANSVYSVFKYDGSSWSDLGVGVTNQNFNNMMESLTIDSSDNVYASGLFTNSSGKKYVAKYNGTSWSDIGGYANTNSSGSSSDTQTHFNHTVEALAHYDGTIYAGGQFTCNTSTNAGDIVAKYEDGTWTNIGGPQGLSGSSYTRCPYFRYNPDDNDGGYFDGSIQQLIAGPTGNLYAVGVGAYGNNQVVKYNGTTWSKIGPDATDPDNDDIKINGTIWSAAIGPALSGISVSVSS